MIDKRKLLVLAFLMPLGLYAQNEGNKVQLHGSVQTEFLVPQDDEKIGTEHTDNALLNNTYADLNLNSKYVDAGLRLEFMEYPLPGFETDFKGWGVPHIYVKGKLKGVELTAGDFYEQFGSGFILRTYEERSLGVDNSLRGARVKVNAVNGLRFTALGGLQRTYWSWDKDSRIFGADAELDLDQYIKGMNEKNMSWMVGGSWVLKNEEKEPRKYNNVFIPGTIQYLNFPMNVNAFDVRSQFHMQNFTVLAEYAMKSEDPSTNNSYTFHKGSAAMLSASYSQKGFSALIQAKRSENMAFRSHRGMIGAAGFINNMPAFAYQHTYALAALYPYATQYCDISDAGESLVPGEWAFQGEVAYTFKRKTAFGGKYGTKLKANFSHIRGLDAEAVEMHHGYLLGTDGYKSSFFGMSDDTYYQDFNLQLDKKISKSFKFNFMYMNQMYNQRIVEGHGIKMYNNIVALDAKYQFNNKMTLRVEYQHLFSSYYNKQKYWHSEFNPITQIYKEEQIEFNKTLSNKEKPGDWNYVLAELTILPHFMISVSDMYGKPYVNGQYADKQHYYLGSVTYSHGAHRAMLGYGRTRAGYNCSGGVCRWVPANVGVQASYNFTF